MRLLIVALAAGCQPAPSQRCRGNAVERYDYSDDADSPAWLDFVTCGADQVCVETEVRLHGHDEPVDWAFCVSPAGRDPMCDPPTGMRCLDDGHLATCVDGYRVSPGNYVRDELCPADHPHCVEPEPGFAFCAADPTPSGLCAGIAARPLETCVDDGMGCTTGAYQQACLTPELSVLCVDGILVETIECTHGTHCWEPETVLMYPCTNL